MGGTPLTEEHDASRFPRTTLWLLCFVLLAIDGLAATDVRVNFTLNTTDADGIPIQQQRYYYVYRPGDLRRTSPVPMVLVTLGGGAMFHRKADQAGFIVVTCAFDGNSTGNPGTQWNADNPRISGYEDYDYLTEVINRVRASENSNDAFITGLSKGGHMALAYACERPGMIQAAGPLDEFMGLTSNIPSAPVPIIAFHGTSDSNVPYTMMKDTVDVWRAVNGLSGVTPVTTWEASPRIPGRVSQATWRGGTNGTQVAFVTIIGGSHTDPLPAIETGYDHTDGIWAFFSQFLTNTPGSPKIVAQPVNNIQIGGQPASFWVTATGDLPLSYQWQKNGEDITGATANWYTVPAADPADSGATFRAVVANDSGIVASTAATLTVTAAPAGPTITTQPADQSVTAGQPVSFTVTATDALPLRYQWRKNGINIAGANDAALSIPAAISADSGASFTVVVTSGASSATSNRAMLTVTPAPGAPILITNPARARLIPGQQATFSVTAWSASPMSYQWQKGTLTGNMADIPGATQATYTIPPATLADHLTLFRSVVSNAAGNVTSADEMLFVTASATPPTSITSVIGAAVQVGNPFHYTIATSCTMPIGYTASPLPAGLSVDQASGEISGTPAETGVTSITIDAANSAGHTSRVLTLTVTDTPPPISIDAWRLAHFGASATDPSIAGDMADPDGDGYTNLAEFNAGSDPLDGASVPAVLAASAPARAFGWVARVPSTRSPRLLLRAADRDAGAGLRLSNPSLVAGHAVRDQVRKIERSSKD
jgi:poly(3-hydroxybutyrate) depolymerase